MIQCFLIAILIVCSGCSINDDLREAIQYQIGKQLISEGKRQLKRELKQGLSYDEYEHRRQQLKVRGPRGNLIETDVVVVTKKGKLRLPKKKEEKIEQGLNKVIGLGQEKEKVHLSMSIALSRARIVIDYGRFELKFKQYYDGDWRVMFEYQIKF